VVYDVATGKSTDVTKDRSPHSSPVWSPDGSQIAYLSGDSIYRKPSDGSGTEELLYKHMSGAPVALTDWSADDSLCFWLADDTTFALPLKGDRKPTRVAHGRGGRFSPDSHAVAYTSNESGRFQIHAGSMSSKGGGLGGIAWRQDGKEIYYVGYPDQALMAMDVATGDSRVLFRPGGGIQSPAQLSNISSRDGQRFVFLIQK
jgi:Tol biopolymer transport system component